MERQTLEDIQTRLVDELTDTVDQVSKGARFVEVKRIQALTACLKACVLLLQIRKGVI